MLIDNKLCFGAFPVCFVILSHLLFAFIVYGIGSFKIEVLLGL